MSKREFKMKKASKFMVWKIGAISEVSYETEHGFENGAKQTFQDTPGDKGKEGTKAYVTAHDNMLFHMSREIRKKQEAGYIEYVNGEPVSEQVTSIDFNTTLPKNFSSYKPKTDIEHKALVKVHNAGRARYSRKYDGMSHLFVHHTTGWEAYTRRMDLTSDRFPHHLELLAATNFGVGTVLVGEVVCYDPNKPGKEDFKAISSFCRSLPEESRKIVSDGKVSEPTFIIFDTLFHNGEPLNNVTYDERSKLWKENFPPAADRKSLVASIDYHDVNPDTWMTVAKDNGWEGFVMTDGAAIPGDKFFSFDGKPERFVGTHKLKPVHSEDVVIYAAAAGGGKRLGGIGAVFVKQIHPETKQYMALGKVGSGFTENQLEELETLCKESNIPILDKDKDAEKIDIANDSGLVCTIEYSDRQPGTNKFRFPVFLHLRNDKHASECVAQKLAPEEE